MRQGWRWFGPDSGVDLDAVRQAGATDVVSALHEIPIGQAWTVAAVQARKDLIEKAPACRSPLQWSVVESIPIPEDIKLKGAVAKNEIDAWIASLEAVSACGIKIVCYNFMPVVDWVRTDIDFVISSGATAMRFDQGRFAAFDLHILRRKNAEANYTEQQRSHARSVYEAMSESDIDDLTRNIATPLPGSTTKPLSLPNFRDQLSKYQNVSFARLRSNLIDFLRAVTPAAEARSVKLTLHPDDPPRSLFGLPRIVSTGDDYDTLFRAVPSPANGMCLCTGSLGVRADNNLPALARRFAKRIHFAHLRATKLEPDGLSFYESAHLEGDVDMIAVLRELIHEDRSRPATESIVFRPDHGQRILDDLSKQTRPGYPAIGRLRGLAELRGAIYALNSTLDNHSPPPFQTA